MTDRTVPLTYTGLRDIINNGALPHERHWLDYKLELYPGLRPGIPTKPKSTREIHTELARDIASLGERGGYLIFGVAEDTGGTATLRRPRRPTPTRCPPPTGPRPRISPAAPMTSPPLCCVRCSANSAPRRRSTTPSTSASPTTDTPGAPYTLCSTRAQHGAPSASQPGSIAH